MRTVPHWTLRKAQTEFWNEKQTLFWLCLIFTAQWELLKSSFWSMKNRYLIFKFYCHKCLVFIPLSILQKVEQFKRCKMSSCSYNWLFKLCSFRWNQSERFVLGKLFHSFIITTKKSFPFFFSASFSVLSWCPGIHFKGSGFSKNNKEPETGKYTQVWQTHLHEQDRLFSSRHPK